MKLSSKTEYALKTVLDLALHRNQGVCRVADIAARQHIPRKFLEQILLTLKAAGVVESRRGAKGGYLLAMAPDSITMADIIKLTDNSIFAETDTPAAHNRIYGLDSNSPFEEIWDNINRSVRQELEGVSIEDLSRKSLALSRTRALEYAI